MESRHDPVTVHYTVIGGKYPKTKMHCYCRFCAAHFFSFDLIGPLKLLQGMVERRLKEHFHSVLPLCFSYSIRKILISNDELGLIDLQKLQKQLAN